MRLITHDETLVSSVYSSRHMSSGEWSRQYINHNIEDSDFQLEDATFADGSQVDKAFASPRRPGV